MFYEIAREGPPTKYELARLRSFELCGRRNNIFLETFDMGTDIAFMLVLFDQSGSIQLPESWTLYAATVGSNCPSAPPLSPDSREEVHQLAIAAACVLAISSFYRLYRAVVQIWHGRRDIKDWADWLYVIVGAFLSIVDPWNGALFINDVMTSTRLERSDYELAVNELYSDVALVLLEDVPQLVIQIIYGVLTGQGAHTTVAWFVAIFSTVMHLATQIHEMIYVGLQLPKLKKLQAEQDAQSDRDAAAAATSD